MPAPAWDMRRRGPAAHPRTAEPTRASAGRAQSAACRPSLEAGAHLCSSQAMKLRSSRFANPGMRHAAGMTLVEILVTLAIAALLMTLAVPSFKPVLERWRIKQSVGALTDTLRLARSEAIKRGGNVVIQKLANNTDGCTLAATPAEWGCGWRVFFDGDGDGNFSAGDELLQLVQATAGIQVRHSSNAAAIAVDRWGKMDGLGAKSFVVAPFPDGSASPATRTLCISSGARIHEEEGAACKS